MSYTPTVWKTGDIITAERMNHLEDGVSNSNGAGLVGPAGPSGASAGFGTVTATVDANTGTPSVDVTASGPDTAKNFSFAFHNLKGEPGASGKDGADGAVGPAGKDGRDGINGVGVPAGGTAGQYLVKKSATDYDTEWKDAGGSGDMSAATYDPTGKAQDIFAYVDNAIRAAVLDSWGASY